MSTPEQCPTCGKPLSHPKGGGAPVCRPCAMQQMMGGDEGMAGSSDANDYEIHEEIGRGASGTIYLATERSFARKVALKTLNAISGDVHAEQRFRAEAEAIAALNHPNIVSVYAVGDLDGRPFFSMQYIAGGSLNRRTDEFSNTSAAVDLVEKIARAVHHAHERGILHRDLKPSNILLDEAGEPYVTDFGIAKREGSLLELTLTGAVIGTPNYMSPEQARGESKQLTVATDVFSLGAILFELLNGRKAFDGDTAHSVMSEVLETDVTFSRNESSRFNRDIASICLKCLEKEPAQRYASALAFAKDLARWRDGEPVKARHINGGERAWRWVRRRPYLVGAISLAVVSMLLGTIVSILHSRDANRAREAAEIAREAAEENSYYASVGSAISARERRSFGEALRHLTNCPEEKRNRFEWRLVNALSKGDQNWRTDFGEGNPLHLTRDTTTGELLVLTRDRHVHYLDPESGVVRQSNVIPKFENDIPKDPRAFECAPGGKHFLMILGDRLFVLTASDGVVVHETDIPAGGSASWLTAERILYAYPPAAEGSDLPDETAWIYELTNGTTTALRPKKWTAPIAVSNDGQFVALVRMEKKVVVYPVESDFGEQPLTRIIARPPFKGIAFSGDSKNIASLWGHNESQLDIYDIATEEKVFEQYWPPPSQIDLCSGTLDVIVTDRESFFTRCRALGTMGRLKLAERKFTLRDRASKRGDGPLAPPPRSFTGSPTGARKHFILGHEAPLTSFLSLPGEGSFYTASRDGSVRYWQSNIHTLAPMRFDDHQTSIANHHPVASHNGEHLLLRGLDGISIVWSRNQASPIKLPEGHQHLAVFDDGRILTIEKSSGRAVCWRLLEDKKEALELWRTPETGVKGEIEFVHAAVTPDERYVACLFDSQVLFFDVSEKKSFVTEIEFTDQADARRAITLSADGKQLAIAGGKDGRTSLLETKSLGAKKAMLGGTNEVRDQVCRFSTNGKLLYLGCEDGMIRVIDPTTDKEIISRSWQAHSHPISALAISQDGAIIATAGGSSIALWSTEIESDERRRLRLEIDAGPGARNWICFAGDDTLLMHTAPDRPIEVFEAPREGEQLPAEKLSAE